MNEKKVYKTKAERLLEGETIISKEPGNSMSPILKSRQAVKLEPTTWEKVELGDIVYCKVKGNFYTHLVKGKNDKKGVLIGNSHGRTNGWTKQVFGKVIELEVTEGGKKGILKELLKSPDGRKKVVDAMVAPIRT